MTDSLGKYDRSGYFDNITVDKYANNSGDISYTVALKRGNFARSISELELDDLIVLRDVLIHYVAQEMS